MAKASKKSAKEASALFHNIMKASVDNKKNTMDKKIESNEIEINLPDGGKAFLLETEWRGSKRYFIDTTSKKYPAFSLTYTDEKSLDSLTFEQVTLLRQFKVV